MVRALVRFAIRLNDEDIRKMVIHETFEIRLICWVDSQESAHGSTIRFIVRLFWFIGICSMGFVLILAFDGGWRGWRGIIYSRGVDFEWRRKAVCMCAVDLIWMHGSGRRRPRWANVAKAKELGEENPKWAAATRYLNGPRPWQYSGWIPIPN